MYSKLWAKRVYILYIYVCIFCIFPTSPYSGLRYCSTFYNVPTKLSQRKNLVLPITTLLLTDPPNSVKCTWHVTQHFLPLFTSQLAVWEVKLWSCDYTSRVWEIYKADNLSSIRSSRLKYFFSRILLCVIINSIRAFIRKWLSYLSSVGKYAVHSETPDCSLRLCSWNTEMSTELGPGLSRPLPPGPQSPSRRLIKVLSL